MTLLHSSVTSRNTLMIWISLPLCNRSLRDSPRKVWQLNMPLGSRKFLSTTGKDWRTHSSEPLQSITNSQTHSRHSSISPSKLTIIFTKPIYTSPINLAQPMLMLTTLILPMLDHPHSLPIQDPHTPRLLQSQIPHLKSPLTPLELFLWKLMPSNMGHLPLKSVSIAKISIYVLTVVPLLTHSKTALSLWSNPLIVLPPHLLLAPFLMIKGWEKQDQRCIEHWPISRDDFTSAHLIFTPHSLTMAHGSSVVHLLLSISFWLIFLLIYKTKIISLFLFYFTSQKEKTLYIILLLLILVLLPLLFLPLSLLSTLLHVLKKP